MKEEREEQKENERRGEEQRGRKEREERRVLAQRDSHKQMLAQARGKLALLVLQNASGALSKASSVDRASSRALQQELSVHMERSAHECQSGWWIP